MFVCPNRDLKVRASKLDDDDDDDDNQKGSNKDSPLSRSERNEGFCRPIEDPIL